MGGEQAAGVLATITQEQRKREGKEVGIKLLTINSICLPFYTAHFSGNERLEVAPDPQGSASRGS
jgi:hypothetical protein